MLIPVKTIKTVQQNTPETVQQKNGVNSLFCLANSYPNLVCGTTDGTTDGTADGQQTVQQTDTNKKVKKVKKVKKNKTLSSSVDEVRFCWLLVLLLAALFRCCPEAVPAGGMP